MLRGTATESRTEKYAIVPCRTQRFFEVLHLLDSTSSPPITCTVLKRVGPPMLLDTPLKNGHGKICFTKGRLVGYNV
jgi:hypothetical protein